MLRQEEFHQLVIHSIKLIYWLPKLYLKKKRIGMWKLLFELYFLTFRLGYVFIIIINYIYGCKKKESKTKNSISVQFNLIKNN